MRLQGKTNQLPFTFHATQCRCNIRGGSELDSATEYTWLISGAEKSKLKPKHIDKMIPDIFRGKDSKQGLLKRGLSFKSILTK